MCVCCYEAALYSLTWVRAASVKSPLPLPRAVTECGGAVGMRERQAKERERERERGLSILSRSCTTSLCAARETSRSSREQRTFSVCIMYKKNVGAASIHLFLLMSAPRESASTDFSFSALCRTTSVTECESEIKICHLLTIGIGERGLMSVYRFPSVAKHQLAFCVVVRIYTLPKNVVLKKVYSPQTVLLDMNECKLIKMDHQNLLPVSYLFERTFFWFNEVNYFSPRTLSLLFLTFKKHALMRCSLYIRHTHTPTKRPIS
jgi:hypothetical protein